MIVLVLRRRRPHHAQRARIRPVRPSEVGNVIFTLTTDIRGVSRERIAERINIHRLGEGRGRRAVLHPTQDLFRQLFIGGGHERIGARHELRLRFCDEADRDKFWKHRDAVLTTDADEEFRAQFRFDLSSDRGRRDPDAQGDRTHALFSGNSLQVVRRVLIHTFIMMHLCIMRKLNCRVITPFQITMMQFAFISCCIRCVLRA